MAIRYLRRYRDSTRLNHWFVALLFVAASLSGLSFFHPSLFLFSALFGGGQWTRILHPFMGVLMVLGFVFLYAEVWRENVLNKDDAKWVVNAPKMLAGDKAGMPPVGKYNAGQKLVFWVFGISLVLLFITGIMFWQPWFAEYFPITLRRLAVLVHAASAVALILSVITHIYAAIWIKGTFRAMMRGTVTEGWAKLNHPLWHKKVTRDE